MASLLLADVDGTLVDATGQLWPASYSVARAAEASDCKIALCSARPARSVHSLANRLGFAVRYAASFQGAMVSRRVPTNEDSSSHWRTIRRCVLDSQVVDTIARKVNSPDSFWWYTETEWGIRSVNEDARMESNVIGMRWTVVGPNLNDEPLLKILIVVADKPEILLAELKSSLLPIECSTSQPRYIEVVSNEVQSDKGASFLRDIGGCGAEITRVIAIGDGMNDLGMFAQADLSITFEDASSSVRAAADVVLPSNRSLALEQVSKLLQTGSF